MGAGLSHTVEIPQAGAMLFSPVNRDELEMKQSYCTGTTAQMPAGVVSFQADHNNFYNFLKKNIFGRR